MMHLTKLEGLGNDYLFLNCLEETPNHLPELARKLSDRHFGVGADGLICVKKGVTGDFTMEMYNADGSRGSMCGNGIRCLGKYVYDKGLTDRLFLTIDTDAGPHDLELRLSEGQVGLVRVDMRLPAVSPKVELKVDSTIYSAIPVDMGNPHAVIFVSDPNSIPLEQLGPKLEHHPDLPTRSNIEFVQVNAPNFLTVRVWERGSGITMACGTGACAAFAAARQQGLCGDGVSVHLPGGNLWIEQQADSLHLTGPVATVFEAELPDPIL